MSVNVEETNIKNHLSKCMICCRDYMKLISHFRQSHKMSHVVAYLFRTFCSIDESLREGVTFVQMKRIVTSPQGGVLLSKITNKNEQQKAMKEMRKFYGQINANEQELIIKLRKMMNYFKIKRTKNLNNIATSIYHLMDYCNNKGKLSPNIIDLFSIRSIDSLIKNRNLKFVSKCAYMTELRTVLQFLADQQDYNSNDDDLILSIYNKIDEFIDNGNLTSNGDSSISNKKYFIRFKWNIIVEPHIRRRNKQKIDEINEESDKSNEEIGKTVETNVKNCGKTIKKEKISRGNEEIELENDKEHEEIESDKCIMIKNKEIIVEMELDNDKENGIDNDKENGIENDKENGIENDKENGIENDKDKNRNAFLKLLKIIINNNEEINKETFRKYWLDISNETNVLESWKNVLLKWPIDEAFDKLQLLLRCPSFYSEISRFERLALAELDVEKHCLKKARIFNKTDDDVIKHFYFELHQKIIDNHKNGLNKKNFKVELQKFHSANEQFEQIKTRLIALPERCALDKMYTYTRSKTFIQQKTAYFSSLQEDGQVYTHCHERITREFFIVLFKLIQQNHNGQLNEENFIDQLTSFQSYNDQLVRCKENIINLSVKTALIQLKKLLKTSKFKEEVSKYKRPLDGTRPGRKTRLFKLEDEALSKQLFVELYMKIMDNHSDGISKKNFYEELDKFYSDKSDVERFKQTVLDLPLDTALTKMKTYIKTLQFLNDVHIYRQSLAKQ